MGQLPNVFTVESPEVFPEGRSDKRPRNFTADVHVNEYQLPLLNATVSEVSTLSENTFININFNQQIRLTIPERTLMHYLQ